MAAPSAVLDEAHQGDIEGALGRIRVGEADQRHGWRRRLVTFLAIVGPERDHRGQLPAAARVLVAVAVHRGGFLPGWRAVRGRGDPGARRNPGGGLVRRRAGLGAGEQLVQQPGHLGLAGVVPSGIRIDTDPAPASTPLRGLRVRDRHLSDEQRAALHRLRHVTAPLDAGAARVLYAVAHPRGTLTEGDAPDPATVVALQQRGIIRRRPRAGYLELTDDARFSLMPE
jgi:hypothetical protein